MEESNLKPKRNERLEVLKNYGLHEPPKDQRFHDIVLLLSKICDVPVAAFNIIDDEHQTYKARVGFSMEKCTQSPSFCGRVLQSKTTLIIENLSQEDEDCRKNLPEYSSSLQFYAGAPLLLPDGFVIGTLFVADTKPRSLSDFQKTCLEGLAQQIVYHCQKNFDMHSLKMKTRAAIHEVNNHAAIISGSSYFLKDASAKPEISAQQISSNADRIQSAIHKVVQSLKNLRNVVIS